MVKSFFLCIFAAKLVNAINKIMKKRFSLVILTIVLCLPLFAQGYGYNPYATQQPTDWSGTGWALNNGYVVTNHHVAENARTIKLKFYNGEDWNEYSAEAVLMDEENDLAILRITDQNFTGFGQLPYALKTSLADVGESVFVLGYPMTTTMGDEIKLTTGIISSHSGFQGSTVQYQISAPVQPGNSGGPLFDDNGNVVGVVNAKHTGAENVSYAIKASYLQTLINQLPNSAQVAPTTNTISSQNLPGKVKSVKNYVCFILCSSRGETPKSSNPRYGAPTIPQGNKVVEMPYIDFCNSANARIKKITITDKETIVEFACNNLTQGGYFQSININKETHIVVGNNSYKLVRAEGIAIAPNNTTYSKPGETKHFKLIFPAIPKATTSFNLIEQGENAWKFYGISLKEY